MAVPTNAFVTFAAAAADADSVFAKSEPAGSRGARPFASNPAKICAGVGARDPRRRTAYATVAGADVTATRGVNVVSSSVANPMVSSGSSSSRASEGAARRPDDASTSAGFAAPSPEKTDAFTGAGAASATCTENPSEGSVETSPKEAEAEATKYFEASDAFAFATPASSAVDPPAPVPATISARVGAVVDAPPAVTTQNTRPGLASATRTSKDPSRDAFEIVGGVPDERSDPPTTAGRRPRR